MNICACRGDKWRKRVRRVGEARCKRQAGRGWFGTTAESASVTPRPAEGSAQTPRGPRSDKWSRHFAKAVTPLALWISGAETWSNACTGSGAKENGGADSSWRMADEALV